jgi:hypothetical protein
MKFTVFLILICTALCAAQTNTALRAELLKMRETDQQARGRCAKGNGDEQMKCLAETLEKIDKPNTARLSEIFDQSGFPSAKEVGKDGVEAFLLILQHAPDEALRRKCLKPVKKAFKRTEITPSEFAGYVDRLLVRQNKPQIYGSNFDFKEGKLVMSAVKDRKNLDKRRRKIGLPTIEEYAGKLKEFYNLDVIISPGN